MAKDDKEFRRMLGRLIVAWRKEACGHYCLTYNQGLGDGYLRCALALENLLARFNETKTNGPH